MLAGLRTSVSKLESSQDDSVNFILRPQSGSIYETRLVRRSPRKAIIYVSCQDGCSQACRMCHLTETRQKRKNDASLDVILEQIDLHLPALRNIKNEIDRIHINFMARGEPFSSKYLIDCIPALDEYVNSRGELAELGCEKRINISTIFPKKMDAGKLKELARVKSVNLYYSLYSARDEFRRYWIPNARSAADGLDLLRQFSEFSRKRPAIHFCFIEGQNDSLADMYLISELMDRHTPDAKLNIVRFNPHSRSKFRESSIGAIERNIEYLNDRLPNISIKIIERVGFDVKASCGMFVGGGQYV